MHPIDPPAPAIRPADLLVLAMQPTKLLVPATQDQSVLPVQTADLSAPLRDEEGITATRPDGATSNP